MFAQHQFYLDRAKEARAGASVSTLENVRDRWLRSEAMWTALAERSASSEKMHAKIIADKAAERAALSG